MNINPKIDDIELSDIVGIDTETTGLNARKEKVLVIALTSSQKTYVLDTSVYTRSDIDKLLERLKTVRILIAHNAKFDASFLYTNYNFMTDNWFCTQLASEILENKPEKVRHNLPATIHRYLGVTLMDSSSKKIMQKSFVGMKPGKKITAAQLEYAGSDTRYLVDLYRKQSVLLKDLGMGEVIRLESRLLPVLVKMEVGGCLIDAGGWRKVINEEWVGKKNQLEADLDAELKRLSEEYPQLRGKFIRERIKHSTENLNAFDEATIICNENAGNVKYSSQTQVIEVFKVLGLEPPIAEIISGETVVIKDLFGSQEIKLPDKKKYSTDENSLKTYTNENPNSPLNRFIEILLEYREYGKLISTYGEKFLALLDENNYIHTSYTQCKTATGRLSSHAPNLQNIPSKGNGGKLREFFIPREGYSMITCDMNSAEVYIAADYSQDQLLLDSIIKGDDMHSKLASVTYSIIFGEKFTVSKSEEPVIVQGHQLIPNTLRTVHKSVLFAKFYKAGANTIYQTLAKYINLFHSPEDRLHIAGRISKALDKELPKLSKYLTKIINEANTKGYLRGSKLGRIRWFADGAYGNAANMPIQNSNGEAMKIALINIDRYLTETGYGRLVMNIHDESVSEVKDEHAAEAAEMIKKITADSLSWFLNTVKGGASVNINKHWEK